MARPVTPLCRETCEAPAKLACEYPNKRIRANNTRKEGLYAPISAFNCCEEHAVGPGPMRIKQCACAYSASLMAII